ncbi:MAG: diacylglycerol kinase family lipid kinase [Phycisphaerae bacterium]|nr:diacylglycerol kinase family lipid kinase [Phycisphaerae bacterium]
MAHKRFEIIVNPIAGAGAAEPIVESLAARLQSAGHSVGVFRTGAAGDARAHASRLRSPGIDALLVAGGDGTISEAIDGLVTEGEPGDRPPLAILPIGTENLLGKLIKAKANVAVAESTLLHGHVREFDVAHLMRPPDAGNAWDAGAGPRCGLGHFLMVAGVGFDAEVVHRLAQKRDGNITYADYVAPIVQTLFRYGFPPIRVEADGEILCEEPALVFVGNIPRYALGLPICQRAIVDDGLLDLVVFKCDNYMGLLMHSVRTILRKHIGHRRVIYRQVRQIEVRSCQPVSLEVDGDDFGQLPVRFTIPGHRVRLLVPAGSLV